MIRTVKKEDAKPELPKLWWFVSFHHGMLCAVELLRVVPVSFDDARAAMDHKVPTTDTKTSYFRDHNVPHIETISTRSGESFMWIAVESTNLLDAAIKATGLLAQKKGA